MYNYKLCKYLIPAYQKCYVRIEYHTTLINWLRSLDLTNPEDVNEFWLYLGEVHGVIRSNTADLVLMLNFYIRDLSRDLEDFQNLSAQIEAILSDASGSYEHETDLYSKLYFEALLSFKSRDFTHQKNLRAKLQRATNRDKNKPLLSGTFDQTKYNENNSDIYFIKDIKDLLAPGLTVEDALFFREVLEIHIEENEKDRDKPVQFTENHDKKLKTGLEFKPGYFIALDKNVTANCVNRAFKDAQNGFTQIKAAFEQLSKQTVEANSQIQQSVQGLAMSTEEMFPAYMLCFKQYMQAYKDFERALEEIYCSLPQNPQEPKIHIKIKPVSLARINPKPMVPAKAQTSSPIEDAKKPEPIATTSAPLPSELKQPQQLCFAREAHKQTLKREDFLELFPILKDIINPRGRKQFKTREFISLFLDLKITILTIEGNGSHVTLQRGSTEGPWCMPHGSAKDAGVTARSYNMALLVAFLTRAGILPETDFTQRAVEKTDPHRRTGVSSLSP